MKELAICEICSTPIGMIDPDAMTLPLNGSQFGSVDARCGIPPLFNAELTWVDLRCRTCGKRPFIAEDKVLLADGRYVLVGEKAAVVDGPEGDELQQEDEIA